MEIGKKEKGSQTRKLGVVPGDRLRKVKRLTREKIYNHENEGTHERKGWEMEESRKEITWNILAKDNNKAASG
jgi:hypothetical protein